MMPKTMPCSLPPDQMILNSKFCTPTTNVVKTKWRNNHLQSLRYIVEEFLFLPEKLWHLLNIIVVE
jgi:hypothetical protein